MASMAYKSKSNVYLITNYKYKRKNEGQLDVNQMKLNDEQFNRCECSAVKSTLQYSCRLL